MPRSRYDEKTNAEIRRLAASYVGIEGLPHPIAAALITKELQLEKRFKKKLGKGQLIGICHRAKPKIVAARNISQKGRELLKSISMEFEKKGIPLGTKATRGRNGRSLKNHRASNGMKNRAHNARLRRELPTVEIDPEASLFAEPRKERPADPHKHTFVSASERRERGIRDPIDMRHLPEPGDGLTAKDIEFLERKLYS